MPASSSVGLVSRDEGCTVLYSVLVPESYWVGTGVAGGDGIGQPDPSIWRATTVCKVSRYTCTYVPPEQVLSLPARDGCVCCQGSTRILVIYKYEKENQGDLDEFQVWTTCWSVCDMVSER